MPPSKPKARLQGSSPNPKQIFCLTPKPRRLLKKPLGKILRKKKLLSLAGQGNFSAVGDISVFFFLKNRMAPNLAVFDLQVKRKKAPRKVMQAIQSFFPNPKKTKNPAGGISREAFGAVKSCLKRGKQSAILISGEEDLLALPAIIHSKENSWVFYGQPGKGMVAVQANKKNKKKAGKILRMMKPRLGTQDPRL